VDRAVFFVQLQCRLIDAGVALVIKVVRPDDIGDFHNGVGIDQYGAEQTGLSLSILRRNVFRNIVRVHGSSTSPPPKTFMTELSELSAAGSAAAPAGSVAATGSAASDLSTK